MHLPNFREPLLIEINLARQLVTDADAIVGSDRDKSQRARLSMALAHIAIEHIEVILHLFENGRMTSGYALMRPAIETTYKCIWIADVATDAKVAKAYMGNDVYGDFKVILKQIEEKYSSDGWGNIFRKVRPNLRTLHERTHTGADQVLRRLMVDDSRSMREPQYDGAQLVSDIRTLAATALLAALPTATPEQLKKLYDLMMTNYSYLQQTS